MMRNGTWFLLAVAVWFAVDPARGAEPVEIGNRRELFLDNLLVDRFEGAARREFQRPVPREVVMTFDKPWEGDGCNFFTVFRDGDFYRMYYRAWASRHGDELFAYAESLDGIHWTRPNLGLVEFDGSKENNIIWRGAGDGDFTVFKDGNPNCAPDARYKAVGGQTSGLNGFKSPDGIHWEKMQEERIYRPGNRGLGDVDPEEMHVWLDSQNLVFWSETENRYVMYYRVFTYDGEPLGVRPFPADFRQKRFRNIEKAVSEDFINWQRIGLIRFGEAGSSVAQFYTNVIRPYHRAPHIYLGMPGMYDDRGLETEQFLTPSMALMPDAEKRREIHESWQRFSPQSETRLMWSRDGVNFDMAPSAFITPGPERPSSWNYSDWVAWHVVETESVFEGAAPELTFYKQERSFFDRVQLRRFTLRLDGFASIHAPIEGGELVTPPLVFEGSALSMNFATSAFGSVRVEIQDADGRPIPGFTLDDSIESYGDAVARDVMWKDNPNLGTLAGKPVRLRFVMRDSDLYSIRFQ